MGFSLPVIIGYSSPGYGTLSHAFDLFENLCKMVNLGGPPLGDLARRYWKEG